MRAFPLLQINDTVLLDIATNKITDVAKFDVGQLCMITGGRNTGRVGMVQHLEKHKGSFTIAHIKDATGNVFSTRSDNVFVIGSGSKPLISLPKGALRLPATSGRPNQPRPDETTLCCNSLPPPTG